MMTSLYLPNEVLLQIAALSDIPTAKALSLTSRVFLDDCRRRLFERVCVPFQTGVLQYAVEGLTRPHIIAHIRSLTVGCLEPTGVGESIESRHGLSNPHESFEAGPLATRRATGLLSTFFQTLAGQLLNLVFECGYDNQPLSSSKIDTFFNTVAIILLRTSLPALKSLHFKLSNVRDGSCIWKRKPAKFRDNMRNLEEFRVCYREISLGWYHIVKMLEWAKGVGSSPTLSLASRFDEEKYVYDLVPDMLAGATWLSSLGLSDMLIYMGLHKAVEGMLGLRRLRITRCCMRVSVDFPHEIRWQLLFEVLAERAAQLDNLQLTGLWYQHRIAPRGKESEYFWFRCKCTVCSPFEEDHKAFSQLKKLVEEGDIISQSEDGEEGWKLCKAEDHMPLYLI